MEIQGTTEMFVALQNISTTTRCISIRLRNLFLAQTITSHTTRSSLSFVLAMLLVGFTSSLSAHHAEGFIESDLIRPDGAAWQEAVGIIFDNNGRSWVWERGGRVWIIDESNPVTSAFLDISDEVGAWHDHGMLGFALHPDFDQTGYVYLLYIVDRHHLLHCTEPGSGVGTPICDSGYDSAAKRVFCCDNRPADSLSGRNTCG